MQQSFSSGGGVETGLAASVKLAAASKHVPLELSVTGSRTATCQVLLQSFRGLP